MMDNQNNQHIQYQQHTNLNPSQNDTRKLRNLNNSVKLKNYKKRMKRKKQEKNVNSIYTNDQKYFLNVATLNIRCLNEIKTQKLADYLDTTDIDIFGITETSISNKSLKYITRQKFMNHEIFGTVDSKIKGTGTLIIVKKDLAKYISRIEKFMGRILKLEFIFSE